MSRSKILLVDDDYEVLDRHGRAFRAAGCQVHTARSGSEAIEFAQQARPHVIVACIIMPGLNGFQMCRKLKTIAKTARIPVVLIGTMLDPADEFWARQTGAAALMTQPIDTRAVLELIAPLV